MNKFIMCLVLLFVLPCLADKAEDLEKQKWIEENQKINRAKFKTANKDWVAGCLAPTTVYVSKNRKIDDGLSANFNAEQICGLLLDDQIVKAHFKKNEKLKYQGCLDGIGMAMQMFDKAASNQKRKEVMAEYCM